jgi:hypothetical protein
MLNLKEIVLIVSSLLIPLSLNSAEAVSINQTSITPEIFAYLKTKEVPYELKHQLDKIFYHTNVMEGLSKIYNSQNQAIVEEGINILILEGFDFQSSRVFQHKSLPEWIFKIGFPNNYNHNEHNEKINAERIRFAEIINQNGKGIIKAPIKHAYMPYLFRCESGTLPVCYQKLPICIVVARFIPRKTLNKVNWTKAQEEILESIGYSESTWENIIQFEDYCMIIDTEPFSKQLEYPIYTD